MRRTSSAGRRDETDGARGVERVDSLAATRPQLELQRPQMGQPRAVARSGRVSASCRRSSLEQRLVTVLAVLAVLAIALHAAFALLPIDQHDLRRQHANQVGPLYDLVALAPAVRRR